VTPIPFKPSSVTGNRSWIFSGMSRSLAGCHSHGIFKGMVRLHFLGMLIDV